MFSYNCLNFVHLTFVFPRREAAERVGPRRARGRGVQHGQPLVVQLQRVRDQALPAQAASPGPGRDAVPAEPRVPLVRLPAAGPRHAAGPGLQHVAAHQAQPAVGGDGARDLRAQQDHQLQGPRE